MKVKKVCLDYGHGGNDLGAVYRGNYESRDNIRLGRLIACQLKSLGLVVIETRQTDVFVSLEDRCKLANYYGVDLFVSLHRNAFIPGQARGIEAFVHEKTSTGNRDLAGKILDSLSLLGFKNRGLKTANFFVLRKTIAPAILVEVGFIDNAYDNNIFNKNMGEIGSLIAEAIGDYLRKMEG